MVHIGTDCTKDFLCCLTMQYYSCFGFIFPIFRYSSVQFIVSERLCLLYQKLFRKIMDITNGDRRFMPSHTVILGEAMSHFLKWKLYSGVIVILVGRRSELRGGPPPFQPKKWYPPYLSKIILRCVSNITFLQQTWWQTRSQSCLSEFVAN
jgi:hypothetical protein